MKKKLNQYKKKKVSRQVKKKKKTWTVRGYEKKKVYSKQLKTEKNKKNV